MLISIRLFVKIVNISKYIKLSTVLKGKRNVEFKKIEQQRIKKIKNRAIHMKKQQFSTRPTRKTFSSSFPRDSQSVLKNK